MANQVTHHGEARRLHDTLDRGADVADVIPELRRSDACIERLLGHLEQLCRLSIDGADGDSHGAVREIAFVPDAHVERDDVSILEDPLWRWDAVDDLVVDRRADAAGEAIESLERGNGSIVLPNEILGDAIELTGRNARTH